MSGGGVTEPHLVKGLGGETEENVVVYIVSGSIEFNSITSAGVKIIFTSFLFLPLFLPLTFLVYIGLSLWILYHNFPMVLMIIFYFFSYK